METSHPVELCHLMFSGSFLTKSIIYYRGFEKRENREKAVYECAWRYAR